MLLRLALIVMIVLSGCYRDSDPAGVYVNNSAVGDTLHLHPDGSTTRILYVNGQRMVEEGTWELDADGNHIWLSDWRNLEGGVLPAGKTSGLSGLMIKRNWRGHYDRIYYSPDEYAAFVRQE